MNAQDNALVGDLLVPATKEILKCLAVSTQESYYMTASRNNPWVFTKRCLLYDLLLLTDLYDLCTLQEIAHLYIDCNMDCTLLIESFTQKVSCY